MRLPKILPQIRQFSVAVLFVLLIVLWDYDFFHQTKYVPVRSVFPWWGTGVGVSAYLALVEILARGKKCKAAPETPVWLVSTLLLSFLFPYCNSELDALYYGAFFYTRRLFFTFLIFVFSVCYTLSRTSLFTGGKSSLWLPVDFLFAAFNIPLRFFSALTLIFAHAIAAALRSIRPSFFKKHTGKKHFFAGTVQWIFELLLILLSISLLSRLDARFASFFEFLSKIIQQFSQAVRFFWEYFLAPETLYFWLIRFTPDFLITSYFFALAYGCVEMSQKELPTAHIREKLQSLWKFPGFGVSLILSAVSLVYALFFLSQAFQFFSISVTHAAQASQFAVRGFYAICAILGINVLFLFGSHFFSQKPPARSILVLFNTFSLLFTLLALLKLCAYVDLCGWTPRRLMVLHILLFFIVFALLSLVSLYWKRLPKETFLRYSALLLSLHAAIIDPEYLSIRNHLDRLESGKETRLDTGFIRKNRVFLTRAAFSSRNSSLVRALHQLHFWEHEDSAKDYLCIPPDQTVKTNVDIFPILPNDVLVQKIVSDGKTQSVTITATIEPREHVPDFSRGFRR